MDLDYAMIGRRIAKRRKAVKLKQSELSEMVEISNTYMSNIERAKSIPSTEVIMRLAAALDTTPDEFLVGASRCAGEGWRDISEKLRPLSQAQLELVSRFIDWVSDQNL